MNRDERALVDAFEAIGWTRDRAWPSITYRKGATMARIYPTRDVALARILREKPNFRELGEVGHLCFVGRRWHARVAEVADAVARSSVPARHLGIMLHALGNSSRRTPLGWRRHYVAGEDDLEPCEALVELGLMERGRAAPGSGPAFRVTEAGAREVGVALPVAAAAAGAA